jgi:hypothetical protein
VSGRDAILSALAAVDAGDLDGAAVALFGALEAMSGDPEPWPRCECGSRFPTAEHLRRHVERFGCGHDPRLRLAS